MEHIADLQKFVSSPSQLKRAIGLNLEGEIKLEPLQKFVSSPSQLKRATGLNLEGEIKLEPEDEDQLEFMDEEVKAKEKIMFCNNIFALSTVLAKRCRKEKDVNVVEETLYSLDRNFC